MSDPYILCLRCRGTFTDEQVKDKPGCPTCGNKGVPGDTRKKATLTLTHHEWRILFMWADNWAARCVKEDEQRPGYDSPGAIHGIIREAHRQAPDLPGLTLREEVQEVANQFGEVEMHGPEGSETVKPERDGNIKEQDTIEIGGNHAL